MLEKPLKVKNTSKYWYYHDEQDKAWWFFKNFNKPESVKDFYKSYYLLTEKFQVLNTINAFDAQEETENLSFFYEYFDKGLVFPTSLFTQVNVDIVNMLNTDVNKLYSLSDLKKHPKNYNYEEALRIVEFGKKNNKTNINDIYIFIKNDVFFPTLINRKTYVSENKLIKKYGVDNSELAYLNTPRFNSFFRDFKKLCASYGAEFSCEIDIYETEDLVSPDGIYLNNEIVYYEDIVDLLEEKYRIVDLSINTNFN